LYREGIYEVNLSEKEIIEERREIQGSNDAQDAKSL